ncbi:VWA domain-containing protein [Lacihabitans sp. LS3-19]|uniref:VWA domain-containing protein n=1 Tax=Lacihabitans sp. LS3-19 TaxID=2487335 RepID=UPI0020CB9130|nr:VWA domain-containing protein [Lacihabitans sp. LS3-19]MCP9770740.1 VWA domain-containing protein [Lacihabitans sp. LS3-19]
MKWFSLKWFTSAALQKFEWANAYYFWLLLLIPGLFFLKWVFKSQKKQNLILSINNISIQASMFVWLRYLVPFFYVLGIFCLILALARPQLVNQDNEKYAEGIDIALAIDISDSMLAKDLQPNRLEAAKNIGIEFISGRMNDRIALVAFAGETTTLSPLTTDYSMLKEYLKSLNTSIIKTSGTAIGLALSSCINKLRDVPGKSKIAILISDGDNTTGSIDPEIAIELAKTFGIRVYTIAIGENSGEEKIDEKTLKMMAEKTDGQFFRANDNNALTKIFTKINLLEKTIFKDQGIKDVSDYYYIYLNWSIVFFLISLFLKFTFLGNILED